MARMSNSRADSSTSTSPRVTWRRAGPRVRSPVCSGTVMTIGPEPEPTQEVVDLSGETTEAVSDLQGAAAVPDEVVPEWTPAELDLTKESPGVPTKDLTVVLEYIHVTFEALKILKLGFVVGF